MVKKEPANLKQRKAKKTKRETLKKEKENKRDGGIKVSGVQSVAMLMLKGQIKYYQYLSYMNQVT